MGEKEKVLSVLSELNIAYEMVEHEAVKTIGETESLNIMDVCDVPKNLFLRDAKGENHYLVIMDSQKKADIKSFQAQLNSTKLGFASESRLSNILGLQKGAVSPLGIINDSNHSAVVVFDEDLKGKEKLGVHPNDNTATVWLSFTSLEKIILHYGNEIRFIKV